jgi:hypothetical protein
VYRETGDLRRVVDYIVRETEHGLQVLEEDGETPRIVPDFGDDARGEAMGHPG